MNIIDKMKIELQLYCQTEIGKTISLTRYDK